MPENKISQNTQEPTRKKKEEYSKNTIEVWDDLPSDATALQRGIHAFGFEKPSPIQKEAIGPILNGKDVIGQAQSGTGKTGAFSIGLLGRLDLSRATTQALVLSPTRELSQQTLAVINGIGIMFKKPPLVCQLLIGGTSTDEDIRQLQQAPPHVVVGCPGRVHDMMRRHQIRSQNIELCILDEADEMLSAGFKEQVYNIFQFFHTNTQVCLFSATMPQELSTLTEKFMRDPIKILVKNEQLTLEGIDQYYVALDDDSAKYSALKDLFGTISLSQCIIYCNSVKRVGDLAEAMTEDGYPVCCIHSNMEKDDRNNAYTEFRSGKYRVLISTNVTARGIDIQQVRTVINFDVPKCIHTYIHRIGRSGRWGRKGNGINFITKRDVKKIKEIESHYHTQIKELPSSFVKHV